MSRKFHENGSQKYKHAVKAIQELLAAEGADIATSAYAEAVHAAVRDAYQKENRANPAKDSHVCVNRLKGSKNCPDKYNRTGTVKCELRLPASDHLSEWVKDGETFSIVSQPYGISYVALKEMIEFCDQHQLEPFISANRAWHFPGSALSIEYRRSKQS